MRKGWFARLGIAAAMGLALGGATAGCASEREPISQVQLNGIKKSDLVGTDAKNPTEWYMRTTVVDTRRTNPFVFPGEQDELRRIRWDVQEKYLIARRAYELVSGSDGKGAKPSVNDGVIVAMYPITSHFDVRRAYDTATGEERNLLVENTNDRRWYERDYMRVDWSTNLVSDPDFGGIWFPKVFGELHMQPVHYFEQDPKSPYAPVWDQANGYMDLTSKWLLQSEAWDFGAVKIPTCIIYNLYSGADVLNGTTDCNDQEITLRTSFKKVGNTDYEASETTGSKFAMFGTFNKDRYGFDRQYGVTDRNWHRLIARHNIWQKSHDGRACGLEGDKMGADASCGKTAGSVCDMHQKQCTIPYERRAVKPVAYHLAASMPQDLWATNQVLIDEWNDAMVNAVAVSREVECRRVEGASREACHAKWFDGDKPKKVNGPVVVMCHNPVSAKLKDSAACGPEGTRAREGDLRFNLLGWVDQNLVAAPLGYGPDGSDPLTGEVVQATAYIYGASLDSYAAMARDLVQLASGDIAPADFVTGASIGASLGTFKSTSPKAGDVVFNQYAQYMAGKIDRKVGMTDKEIASRVAAVDASELITSLGGAAAIGEPASASARLGAVESLIAAQGQAGVPGFGGAAEAEARLKSLRDRAAGTETEAELMDSKTLLNSAISAHGDPEMMRKLASPFGGLGILEVAQIKDSMRSFLEERGVCMLGTDEFNAPHFEGLARRLRDKVADLVARLRDKDGKELTDEAKSKAKSDVIFRELRALIYKAVAEHEVGHTLALRHNFQGSWDSMNFHPNYWKLRSNSGKSMGACTGARDEKSADTCMGPRYLDPPSVDELGYGDKPHAGIEEYAYSSIMDYGYDFNTDLHGIGSYDRAAMKFIYGGVVETFDGDDDTAKRVAPTLASKITEQWMTLRNDPKIPGGEQIQPTHYTELARVLKLYDDARCHPSMNEVSAIDGVTCDAPRKDHASVRDMEAWDMGPGYRAEYARHRVTKQVRWPYRFGTDEYARYPHILRFDAGADIFEAADNASKLYEYRYVLDFYRRGRRGWVPSFMFQRLWDRYFSRFHTLGWLAAQKTTEYSAMYPKASPSSNVVLNSDNWGRGYTLAMSLLFDTLQRSATRPQPGGYREKAEQDPGQTQRIQEVVDFDQDGKPPPYYVGVLDGRYVDEVYDNVKGGSFDYLSYAKRMGTFIEKPLSAIALSILTPPVHTFSRDTYLDGRNVLLNFRSAMPKAYDRLYAGILGEDWDTIAPYVDQKVKGEDKIAPVSYPKLWEKDALRPAGATLIDPLIGYRFETSALISTLYYGSGGGSQSFTNNLRVWIEGGPEGIKVPVSEKIVFFEPESGVTWAAHRTGTDVIDGKPVEAGVGARMLTKANLLLAAAYKVEIDPATGQPIYDPTGRPKWRTGAAPGEVQDANALLRLRKYVGLLNVERQAMWRFGIGPLRW